MKSNFRTEEENLICFKKRVKELGKEFKINEIVLFNINHLIESKIRVIKYLDDNELYEVK